MEGAGVGAGLWVGLADGDVGDADGVLVGTSDGGMVRVGLMLGCGEGLGLSVGEAEGNDVDGVALGPGEGSGLDVG